MKWKVMIWRFGRWEDLTDHQGTLLFTSHDEAKKYAELHKEAAILPAVGSWSPRCDCYNNHNSSSGRCNCRSDGDCDVDGVYDPTGANEVCAHAYCSHCREHCQQNHQA